MHGIFRVRVETQTSSGELGRFGTAIERLDGVVASIDKQEIDKQRELIDAVISLPADATADQLIAALAVTGAGTLRTWSVVSESIDPVLRAIRWACGIVSAGRYGDDEVLRVISEICECSGVRLQALDAASPFESVQLARSSWTPVVRQVAEVSSEIEVGFSGPAWVLAVPDARLEPTWVAVVIRPIEQTFSTAEIERIEAILALRRRAAATVPILPESHLPDDGPWLDMRSA